MKTLAGHVRGRSAQAAVTAGQIVVAAEVTQEGNDKKQFHPIVEKTAENTAAAGAEEKVGAALADAGYWSEANVEAVEERGGPEPFVATTKDRRRRKSGAPRATTPRP